jgi:CRISPR-associated endonuclease Csn1
VKYRLGIDLGTNSIGWAAVQLNEKLGPTQLIDVGARIFSDARNPKDKSSNAAQRRGPRSLRRNRDRKLTRSLRLMNALVEADLMPDKAQDRKALEADDPWVLRALALDTPLSLHKIGRALFHLNQRRGFKSNRKADGEGDGVVHEAIARTQAKLSEANARSLGELFGRARLAQIVENKALQHGQRKPLPLARVRSRGEGAKLSYDYYPQRDMILAEFDAIWAAQAPHHPEMTMEVGARLRSIIEYQRPLKPQPVGICSFLQDQPRAPRALPSIQRFRILQEVNNLRVGSTGESLRDLSAAERETLVAFLATPSSKTGKRTFDQVRRKLGLPASERFNMESAKRAYIDGDLTAARLIQDDAWGPAWLNLSRQDQDRIVVRLLDEESEETLQGWLKQEYGLDSERARKVSKARLPDRYGNLSKMAVDRLLPHLEAGQRYDEAATLEFRSHSLRGDGEVHDTGLPYYGEVLTRQTSRRTENPKNDEERFGKVANPTVHVALNELRKVINDLIKHFGEPPEQIVLELARDLPLSAQGLKELERTQTDNQKANEQRRKQLSEHGQIDTYENRLRLRLYEEYESAVGLPVQCVFSGKPISVSDLFSANVEIEHILPVSRTNDDGFSNKVLATRQSNRDKGNRSPHEAFGLSPIGYDWESITQRADDLPSNKRWRFAPSAMERFDSEAGFLDRHLNDTRYIAKLGKEFVESIFGGQGAPGQPKSVWVVPGRLTADLRHYAGFNGLLSDDNKKKRTDHRHHAIDALVVALSDASMVKRAADLAKREDRVDQHEVMKALAEPLKRYRRSLEDRLGKLTVSHKPDHGFQDAMHNDTAYGITGDRDSSGQMLLVTRKTIDSFEKYEQLAQIRDPDIRERLESATFGLSDKASFAAALKAEADSQFPPIRSIRIVTPMRDESFVVVQHGEGHEKAYKGDGNYCYDIWTNEQGRWTGEVITTFQAYQLSRNDLDWWRRSIGREGQPLQLRIRKGDMLELDGPGGRQRVVVYQFSDGMIVMAEHNESDASARVRAKELPRIQKSPSSLQKARARAITVSPSGRLRRH